MLDLDTSGLTRLGQELDVGKEATDDEQSVAGIERFHRRPGTDDTDAARGVRAGIRHAFLAKLGLDDWRPQAFGGLFQLTAAETGASAGEDGIFLH